MRGLIFQSKCLESRTNFGFFFLIISTESSIFMPNNGDYSRIQGWSQYQQCCLPYMTVHKITTSNPKLLRLVVSLVSPESWKRRSEWWIFALNGFKNGASFGCMWNEYPHHTNDRAKPRQIESSHLFIKGYGKRLQIPIASSWIE